MSVSLPYMDKNKVTFSIAFVPKHYVGVIYG